MIIAEGRKVAEGLEGAKKADLLRNCDEAEILCNQLADYCRRGMVRTLRAVTHLKSCSPVLKDTPRHSECAIRKPNFLRHILTTELVSLERLWWCAFGAYSV